MNPAFYLAFGSSPWVLTAEKVKFTMTHEQMCIAEACAPPGEIDFADDGTWEFRNGVRVRWTDTEQADVSIDGKSWSKAKLTFETASENPVPALKILAISHPTPLPGRWSKDTVACDRKKPVWVFTPILRHMPNWAAYPDGTGTWSLRVGMDTGMCEDAKGKYFGVR